jgi:Immunity protein 27
VISTPADSLSQIFQGPLTKRNDLPAKMIEQTETKLVGDWKLINGAIVADQVAQRIYELISEELQKVSTSSDGWSVLYRDPRDGRFWELIYLQGEMEGGGPPTLIHMSEQKMAVKYPSVEPKKFRWWSESVSGGKTPASIKHA